MSHTPLISLLDRWQPRRIAVIGDFILDRYIFGNAERLSPDAPVPVLGAQRREHRAGGAGNVCRDLVALRCQVDCLGVRGEDRYGRMLVESLDAEGIETDGLIPVDDRPTTVKHNFIGLAQHRHPQKMFRMDDESDASISAWATDALLGRLERIIDQLDVLCLEDYGKGVLTAELSQRCIALAHQHDLPVMVDPAAGADYDKYRGARCLTPNRIEAARAVDDSQAIDGPDFDEQAVTEVGRKLMRRLGLQTLVLTLDRHGMLLIRKGRSPLHVPTHGRDVYDVTGAGDMVLATLAAAQANDADWPEAVMLANLAAGLEVERFGVVPITLDEMILAALQAHQAQTGKLRRLERLLPEINAYRRQGKTIAFTNGCFDILHAGHVQFLRQAAQRGDLLVVGLNTDASIRRIKGPQRPVNQQADRVMVLSELESVDYIVLFDQDTPNHLLDAIRPETLVKGGDYSHDQVVGHEIVERYGGQIALVDLVQGRSTTNLIQRMGQSAGQAKQSNADVADGSDIGGSDR